MNFFRKDKQKNPILQLFLWHFSQLIHFLINFLAEKLDFRKLRPILSNPLIPPSKLSASTTPPKSNAIFLIFFGSTLLYIYIVLLQRYEK